MFCEKCGTEVAEGQRFCTNCGFQMPVYCRNCGRKMENGEKFCRECGAAANGAGSVESGSFVFSGSDDGLGSDKNKYDRYRNELVKKSQIEQCLLAVVAGAVFLFSVLYYINNPGEDRFGETLVVAVLTAGGLIVAYRFVAGSMGVFEATKYLKKFDTIREMTGEKEAVLFIEKEFNPEERGKGAAAGSVGVAGGCLIGTVQIVIGFAVCVLAVIVVLAFC